MCDKSQTTKSFPEVTSPLDDNEYRNAILNALCEVHPPRRVFTDEECADIIIADIQNDAETLSAIYAKAEKREKARLKQIKAGLRK